MIHQSKTTVALHRKVLKYIVMNYKGKVNKSLTLLIMIYKLLFKRL